VLDDGPLTRRMPEPLLAAGFFAAATAYGAVVSIREDVPGEPLGLRVPLTVSAGVVLGWGSGLSAPWPMPAAALLVAADPHRSAGPTAGRVLAAIGAGVVTGTLIEPITWQPQRWTPATASAIGLNLIAAVILIRLGRRPAAAERGGGIAGHRTA